MAAATPRNLDPQLFEMLRGLDNKVSEINERTIRIEAQEFGVKLKTLTDDYNELKLDIERIKTRVAPVLAFGSTIFGVVVTLVTNAIIR